MDAYSQNAAIKSEGISAPMRSSLASPLAVVLQHIRSQSLRLLQFGIGLLLLIGSLRAQGSEVELLSYQSPDYRYSIGSAPSGWEQPNFDDSGWSAGTGAFGSGGGCPLQVTDQTLWPEIGYSQLYLRHDLTIPAGATDVRVLFSVDNDASVYFNGSFLGSVSHEGCPSLDDFTFDVPQNLVTPGQDVVSFLAVDRGAESFFDARVVAQVAAVPEPGSLAMFGAGLLASLTYLRCKRRFSMSRTMTLTLISLFMAMNSLAWGQGGVFVTGHDPDYHAYQGDNAVGAQHIIQDALQFVTHDHLGNILLVTDLRNPGGDESDPRLGMTAAGFSFDVADYGSGSVLDLHTVDFADYSAVVVASDYGGWLRQDELDILNARSNDILTYINHGGGLVAFAESGSNHPTDHRFGFLPFLVADSQKNQSEQGNTLTPFGLSLGLTDNDINGNESHNVFTATGGMNVVDYDSEQQILSLAFYGKVSSTSVGVPEPGPLALLCAILVGGVRLRRFRKRGR